MHACELGAVGVYRGHRCVARYIFRQALYELDEMRSHEQNHVEIFRGLLDDRKASPCFAYKIFFFGGLFYGVIVGLLGLRAIGESTKVVESIVIHELNVAAKKLSHDECLVEVIQKIRIDEVSHQKTGVQLLGHSYSLSRIVTKLATVSAYTAKNLAYLL